MAEHSESTFDFEQSLQELEDLVRRMEQGELKLEESLEAFTRGVELTKQCREALEAARLRVSQLMPDGRLGEIGEDSPKEP